MMLGVVVAKVSDARLPVDKELNLACVIAYPIKAHVDRFRSFLFDGVVGKASSRVVYLDWQAVGALVLGARCVSGRLLGR